MYRHTPVLDDRGTYARESREDPERRPDRRDELLFEEREMRNWEMQGEPEIELALRVRRPFLTPTTREEGSGLVCRPRFIYEN